MTAVWLLNGYQDEIAAKKVAVRYAQLAQKLGALGQLTLVVQMGESPVMAAEFAKYRVRAVVLANRVDPSPRGLWGIAQNYRRLRDVIRRERPTQVEALTALPAILLGLACIGMSVDRPFTIYRREHQRVSLLAHMAGLGATWLTDATLVSNTAMQALAARQDRRPVDRILCVMSGGTAREGPEGGAEAVRAEFGLEPARFTILAVGRLHRDKGFDVLVTALQDPLLQQRCQTLIVGEGDERTALSAMIGQGHARVALIGNRHDMPALYAVADVVVIPSRVESFGRVLVETMAAKRAVIASRVGGLAVGVVHGVNGLLVAPESPNELAGALRQLLENLPLTRRLAQANYEKYLSRHTMEHMASTWLAETNRVRALLGHQI